MLSKTALYFALEFIILKLHFILKCRKPNQSLKKLIQNYPWHQCTISAEWSLNCLGHLYTYLIHDHKPQTYYSKAVCSKQIHKYHLLVYRIIYIY